MTVKDAHVMNQSRTSNYDAQEISSSNDRGMAVRLAQTGSKAIAGLTIAFAVIGILLRIQRYLIGRSFRGDEAGLALAIERTSLWNLVSKPLGGNYTAPLAFVGIEKIVVMFLGTQDIVFRLVPLLSGILAVALLFFLARQAVGGIGALVCTAAFAVNWMVLFYSSDLRQYSTDICMTLIVYAVSARFFKQATITNAVLLAAAGLTALAISHPVIFVLASSASVLLWRYRAERWAVVRVMVIGAVWAVGFAALYALYYRTLGQNSYIINYWDDLNGLMPIPPWKDPNWFVIRTASFFSTVLAISWWPIALALCTVGVISFQRRGQWQWAAWLVGSVLFTLLGSATANYPFKGRLILFLVPAALLAMGEGVSAVARLLHAYPALNGTLTGMIAISLLWTPIGTTLGMLRQPRSTPYPEDIKPVLEFIRENGQADDLVVVYDQAAPTYAYYAPFYELSGNPTLYLPEWRQEPRKYLGFIDALPKNRRIWIVFSAVLGLKGDVNARDYMLDYVRSIGGDVIKEINVSGGISSGHLIVLK